QAGQKIEVPKTPTDAKVINLMDALRRIVEAASVGSRSRTRRHRAGHPRRPHDRARGRRRARPRSSTRQSTFGKRLPSFSNKKQAFSNKKTASGRFVAETRPQERTCSTARSGEPISQPAAARIPY